MKHKLLLFFSFILLVGIGCKKNKIANPQTQTVDPVGTWSLYSTGGSTVGSSSITTSSSSTFPCLLNNKLTLNADLSYLAFYAAADTCYLEHTQQFTEIVGKAGDSTKGSYKVVGHTIYLKTPNGNSVGIFSESGNSSTIEFKDTISNNIYVSTFQK